MKTTAEIIQELRAQGHTINTYTRTKLIVTKEGESKRVADAVRIIGIDGMKFPKSGGAGNKAAREMTGDYLSRRMVSQRRKARAAISAAKLTKAQKVRIAKLNKQLKEAGKKPIPQITARRRKKKEGYQSLFSAMKNTIQHAQHKSYSGVVQFWIDEWERQHVMPLTCAWLKRHINTTSDEALYSIVGSQGSLSPIMVSGKPRDGMSWEEADEHALERLKKADQLRRKGKVFTDYHDLDDNLED